jgi:hypothetical protein
MRREGRPCEYMGKKLRGKGTMRRTGRKIICRGRRGMSLMGGREKRLGRGS